MSVKHIISYSRDGLGGRLLCIMNTLIIAKYFECTASVVWKNNAHISCDFNNLFRESKLFEIRRNINEFVNQESALCSVHNLAIKKYRHTNDFMIGIRDDMLKTRILREEHIKMNRISSFNMGNQVTIKAMNSALHENDVIVFHARKDFSRLYNIGYKDIFHENLMPLEYIQSHVDSYVDNNNFNNILGIQVRRGDLTSSSLTDVNIPSGSLTKIRIVPTNKYFEKIDDLLKTRNYKKIFLATESVDIISEFENKYKGMIINYPVNNFERNEEGVIYALIDMILLSKCSLIVSGRSQLPATAAKIGNIEHICLDYGQSSLPD